MPTVISYRLKQVVQVMVSWSSCYGTYSSHVRSIFKHIVIIMNNHIDTDFVPKKSSLYICVSITCILQPILMTTFLLYSAPFPLQLINQTSIRQPRS